MNFATEISFFTIFLATAGLAAPTPKVCTVREMNDIRFSAQANVLLTSTGTVQRIKDGYCIIEDATGRSRFQLDPAMPAPEPGDLISVTCLKPLTIDHDKRLGVLKLDILGKKQVSAPLRLKLEELDDRKHDQYLVDTEATVVDILHDDVDARLDVLLLKDSACRIPLFVPVCATNSALLGARIRVIAQYDRLVSGIRRISGPYLSAEPSDITILSPPCDPFSAPALDPGDYVSPREVAAMGQRTLSGAVLATWSGDKLMLRAGNVIANVQLAVGQPVPRVGTSITVSGYPVTDLYRINIVKAVWKQSHDKAKMDDTPVSISIRQITHRSGKQPEIDPTFHGRMVRLSGIVISLPSSEDHEQRLVLDVMGKRIPVDISSCTSVTQYVSPGCEIEVTGRCFLEISDWRPYDAFPKITGIAIILQTSTDLTVLRSPPWWTAKRLFWLVCVMGALLLGFIIWNRALNKLVERRGRQLYRAEIKRAQETLRVNERTRLAVELHDSLSQNLTGVALQIKTGRLELAAQALKSCREELRNCLWDLRNNAIDCDTLDQAIRRTIAPQVENVQCHIRFNVPRHNLSDNTTYAILRIIRELVSNAIRHGHATDIRVAGAIEPGRLLFSVRDNGCGFNLDHHPGITEGHFGLQGIQERVDTLEGEMNITTESGAGTKVVIALPVINATQEGHENT